MKHKTLLTIGIIFGIAIVSQLALALSWTNVQTDSSGNLYAPANINASGTITINGVAVSTSTPTSLAGTYLGVSGNSLTVSSTLASSTINLTISNPTTTAPSYTMAVWDYQRTFNNIQCYDAVGTTTLVIYNTTAFSTTTQNALVSTSSTIPCGINGWSSTSFTSSTLKAGYGLLVQVTSTVGTPTQVRIQLTGLKQ